MAQAEEHLNALLVLAPEERIEAANKLLDSVDDDDEPGWEDAWLDAMVERLRGIQDGSRQTVDAETAHTHVLERLATLRQ